MYKYTVHLNSDRCPMLVKEKPLHGRRNELHSSHAVYNFLNENFNMSNLAEEYVYLICTDTKLNVNGVFELSHGAAAQSLVGTREIFIRALLSGATHIFLAHNHPSGDITPSKEDVAVTHKVKQAAELLNMRLLDHIIIGDNCFYSFAESEKL